MAQKISRLPRSYKCSYNPFMYKAIYGDYNPIYSDRTDPPGVEDNGSHENERSRTIHSTKASYFS